LLSLVNKFRKALLIGIVSVLYVFVFIIDVIRRSVELDLGLILVIREIVIIISILISYILIESIWKREQKPSRKLGFAIVIAITIGTATGLLFLISPSGFELKVSTLLPLGFDSVVWANIYSIVMSITMLIMLLILRDIIFAKRRKETKRNFIILLILIITTALVTLVSKAFDIGIISNLLYIATILAMILNSLRVSWIVYLSKREKILSLVYGFLLFCIFIVVRVIASSDSTIVGQSLLFYSPGLQSFISSVSLFATMYFGMTFISTLFHLPTAEAFDRKISEVSSLHNLSKLVTQVFDFNELVESVTTMTLDVCGAKSAWLEIIHSQEVKNHTIKFFKNNVDSTHTATIAHKNISLDETKDIISSINEHLRQQVITSRKPLVIDSIRDDKRTKDLADINNKFSSLAVVPLVSHDNVIGILYATKDVEYGFDKDDVDVISAFADQATIAIENSRLIEKSIERERLMREIMLAQEMQKKLLPQELPQLPEIELEALSTPAFEVGGDYYDFLMIDDTNLGILVGDVSGKGVSAAFYMAEMKGIFQSLGKMHREPKDFLINAQKALITTIDKRSFISVIYAVIDLTSGKMKVSRAGHCPMLLMTNNGVEYVRPTGLGLGMGTDELFEKNIEQSEIQLQNGDVIIFYTDGITEARQFDGDEYGYEKLKDVLRSAKNKSAMEIRDLIIADVDKHMNHTPPEDDLTIVVMKWKKNKNSFKK